MFLLIATKTGWEDRLSLLPIWDEWQKQTVDARLLFVEDSIGYIYLDFVEHCEGARPSVYPPSLLPLPVAAVTVSRWPHHRAALGPSRFGWVSGPESQLAVENE